MKDKDFLQWIHDRLQCVHGERYNTDYMFKLRAIIAATPEDRFTPNSELYVQENKDKVYECPECGLAVPHGMKCHHNI